ncbi:AraC family transcriptional regulator [Paenibacillus nanensis]|uniref:AraC family transcriptional regulator n=1 Tax=Paenibacillus nanensis TaxID=393251 RepID=A0A3A1VIR2_9BACL|nr:AraC family transcriptional regulator [Paenibacillus nanensis]RIX59602.1 AraC family transcriptional regulator [Paenibacillus nanensis]
MFNNMREDHHELLEIHYFTPSAFEKTGPAWPIRLGATMAKPNYHMGPVSSPYYYLILVLEGEGTFLQGGRAFPLKPGDLYGLFPKVTHEYYTVPEAPLRKVFLTLDGKHAHSLMEKAGLSPHCPHQEGGATEEAVEAMKQFFDLMTEGERPHADLSRLSCMYRLFDALSASGKAHPAPAVRTAAWLEKGKDYLDIHYADGITVEGTARYVGVDRAHFTKEFHKKYGMSPMNYLQQLRMNEAIALLKDTDYKLAEIAHSVGFIDLPTFSKAFRKYTGLAPSRFRASN